MAYEQGIGGFSEGSCGEFLCRVSMAAGRNDMNWDTVNITTEMYDAAESECFSAARGRDKRAANKTDVLMKAIGRCVDEVQITKEQNKRLRQLVEQAVAEERVVCNTYADETDGWVLFQFSKDDFLNAGGMKKDRNGKVVAFDDRADEPRTWRFT